MKKFFSIAIVLIFISSTLISCSKQQVLDTIRNNPGNLAAPQQTILPQLVQYNQDLTQALVVMPNGQQTWVRTLIQPLFQNGVRVSAGQNGTGIMVNTPCRPNQVSYDPVTGQPIAEGFTFNQGMSASHGTVYVVRAEWVWVGTWQLKASLDIEPITGQWSPALNPATWTTIQWFPGWFYRATVLAGPGQPIIRL